MVVGVLDCSTGTRDVRKLPALGGAGFEPDFRWRISMTAARSPSPASGPP